jgi:hypothetical protein
VAEFRRKAAAKDHFLTEVLRGPEQFVKGDQRDVDDRTNAFTAGVTRPASARPTKK